MTDPTQTPTPEPDPPFRWGLGLAIFAIGLAVTGAGFLLFGLDDPAAYLESAIVNLGTTILLAAALVWLERALVRTVRRNTQQVAQQAATQAAAEAAERTAEVFRPQLEDLDRRISERSSSRIEHAAETAQRIADLGTYESVRDALAEAARIDAIAKKRTGLDSRSTTAWEIIVPAGDSFVAPRMCVAYDTASPIGSETVSLSVFGNREASTVIWHPDRSPEDVFDDLQEAMVAGGLAALGRTMSAEALFRNLSFALGDAIVSRRAGEDAWRGAAPTIEMVSESCVMTEAGVEFREPEFVINATSFGWYDPSDEPIEVYGHSYPDKPKSIDQSLWDEVLRRGDYHYPRPDPDLY